MPAHGASPTRGQKGQGVLQPFGDLLRGEHSDPRRRELYGKRYSVQPPAYVRHGLRVPEGQDEGGIVLPGPFFEQPHRLVTLKLLGRGRVPRVGAAVRRTGPPSPPRPRR